MDGLLDEIDDVAALLTESRLGSEDPLDEPAAPRALCVTNEPLRSVTVVTVKAVEQAPAMLALADDPSERVRTSAIQLIASFSGEAVDERLATIVADAKRPLAERSVALAGLEGRAVGSPERTARLVLPALLDDSLPLREATDRLLTKLMSRDLLVDAKDKAKLHAAWRSVVGLAE